jgi:hypothetical protein
MQHNNKTPRICNNQAVFSVSVDAQKCSEADRTAHSLMPFTLEFLGLTRVLIRQIGCSGREDLRSDYDGDTRTESQAGGAAVQA